MKKTAFLKRLLSIATASMLLASACSTLFTASAETASRTAIQTYQLLDTEDYKAGWNTDGVAQNNLMTDVVSGKTLNRVSANYDPSGEVRVYIDCKTPDRAGFSLDAIHSVAYYFKNDAGKELTINFQNFTDKPIEGGWLTAFGRLMNCAVYLVPSDGNLVKATASDGYGLVTIPEGFEGYVVYDTDTRSKEASGIAYDLLTSEHTFSSAMAFTVPANILKGGDVFYYGEISASTGAAKDFIATVKSDALYEYQLTSDVTWALDNRSTSYDVKLDDLITTGTVSGFGDKNEFHFKTTSLKDLGGNVADISVISFYVKNSAGRGTLNISFGDMNVRQWLYYGDVSLYDINTEMLTTIHINVDLQNYIAIPSGFEGYVFFDPKQSTDSDFNAKYASILNGKDITFHQPNSQTLIGNTISFGSITAWCGDYSLVKQTLINKSNTISTPMSDWGGKTIEVSGVSPDGDCRQFKSNGNATDWYNMWFDLSKSQLGSQAVSSEFISKNEALGVWFKNASASAITIGMSEDKNYPSVNLSYRLFDTKKQTVTEPTSGNISVPAGFEGYIFILLDTTTTSGMSWAEYAANGGVVKALYLSALVSGLADGESYYIGDLGYVRSVDEFIESRLEVTLEGDANKDGSADILDLVRLKKNAAGISEATVYVPNISYGGNNDTTAATTVSNLRKQLLGADYQPAAVSQEVHDRLVPPAQETVEADTVPVAASSVGVSIYHMTAGDWDKVYGSEKAESDFINYYPGNDISDVRTAKERDSAAWIGISGAYFNDAEGSENARARLAKYVETLKAERLWNTVAGFEFEEITGATNDNPGKLEQFKELSEYLHTKYPEKRQFAVLAVAEVHQAAAVEKAYQYVTDIAFDWYAPETADQMLPLFNEMKINTGLTNAKYWFLPGLYTESNPTADTAAYALKQLEACYTLLMEQPASNRGGLYLYNWQTFSVENGTAYGLDQLLNNENYAEVKAKIFEVANALKLTFTVVNEGISEVTPSNNSFPYNSAFSNLDLDTQETFSYYIKNNGDTRVNGQMFFGGNWYMLSGSKAIAYDINTGKCTVETSDEFHVPAGFEGYIMYDLRDCTTTAKITARELLKSNNPWYNCNEAWSLEIKDIAFSNSFEMADAYFKSLTPVTVFAEGGVIEGEYTNYNYNGLFDAVNPSDLTTFSYYIKNSGTINANGQIWFGWKALYGEAYAYNIKDGSLTAVSGEYHVQPGFEGYIIYNLKNCTLGDEVTAATDIILGNTPFYYYNPDWSVEVRDLALSTNSFARVMAYYKLK